jgi:formiminotetrahydrofolate cyclodeaminase
MDVASLTIDEFLHSLGSSDPTPGGGALAALSGAMAAAMLAMVCNLTIGRPRYADVEEAIRTILAETLSRQSALLELANADADAYGAVRDAYRLPNGTDAELTARKDAIARSMERATEVPVQTAEATRAVLELTARAGEIGNRNMLGDVAVGAHLGLAAVRGAVDQARLNLVSLGDSPFAAGMERRLTAALAESERAALAALESVQRRSPDS